MLMGIRKIAKQGITHPFGDHRTVKQAFPAAIPSKLSDPFLMCDYFDGPDKEGEAQDPDHFPVDWHPHRGFDIATYLKSGVGRHGDSLGHRETFSTPGMQWISTGSGVEHAEGGGTPKGEYVQGFQIWVNVPGERKMDDPRYGTVPTTDLPLVTVGENSSARILAGDALGVTGPFRTVQPVQMVDFGMEGGTKVAFDVGQGLDTAMLFVYEGSLTSLNGGGPIETGNVVLFDADSDDKRGLEFTAENKAGAILFAGKKLKEPIAWHGPIVMNTQEQIQKTFVELRSGQFPPKRVSWDYKRLATKPTEAK